MMEKVTIRIFYYAVREVKESVFDFQFERIDGIYVCGTSSYTNNFDHFAFALFRGAGYVEYELDRMLLHRGTYFLSVSVFTEPDEPFWAEPSDRTTRCTSSQCIPNIANTEWPIFPADGMRATGNRREGDAHSRRD